MYSRYQANSNPRPRRVWPDHGPLGFQGSYPKLPADHKSILSFCPYLPILPCYAPFNLQTAKYSRYQADSNPRPRRIWPDHGPRGFQGSYPKLPADHKSILSFCPNLPILPRYAPFNLRRVDAVNYVGFTP
jgi:hypothetical protein